MDRAALDAAMAAGIAVGGWCPKGRRAEGELIPERYPLKETPNRTYAERTRWNVHDSDATLVIASLKAPAAGGTKLTIDFAREIRRPCLVVDPARDGSAQRVCEWLWSLNVRILNVAGPREQEHAGVYAAALAFLADLLPSIAQVDAHVGVNESVETPS